MSKKLFLLIGCLLCATKNVCANPRTNRHVEDQEMSVKEESSILFFDELAVLSSIPKYKEEMDQLKKMIQEFESKNQELYEYNKKEAGRLQQMYKEVEKKNKDDMAASAQAMQKFEAARNQVNKKISQMREELLLLDKKVRGKQQRVQELLQEFTKKSMQAIQKIVESESTPTKMVVSMPSGRVVYMRRSLDRTSEIIKELHVDVR